MSRLNDEQIDLVSEVIGSKGLKIILDNILVFDHNHALNTLSPSQFETGETRGRWVYHNTALRKLEEIRQQVRDKRK